MIDGCGVWGFSDDFDDLGGDPWRFILKYLLEYLLTKIDFAFLISKMG